MHKPIIIAALAAACPAYLLFSCFWTIIMIRNVDRVQEARHIDKLRESREAISGDMSRNNRVFMEEYRRKAGELEEEKKRLRDLQTGTAGVEK